MDAETTGRVGFVVRVLGYVGMKQSFKSCDPSRGGGEARLRWSFTKTGRVPKALIDELYFLNTLCYVNVNLQPIIDQQLSGRGFSCSSGHLFSHNVSLSPWQSPSLGWHHYPLCVTFSPLLIVLIAGDPNRAAGAPLSPGRPASP